MLDAVWQDLKYAVRSLRLTPGFTTAVVVTLALGLGANATMFGIVDRMLFRPPPMLHDPATAHRLYYFSTFRGQERPTGSQYARYLDLAKLTHSFSQMAAYTRRDFAVGVGDAAREMSIGIVSANFFGFFDAPPPIGRYFSAEEDALPNGQPVAVLSYATWMLRFGGRRDALGKTIQIGPTIYTIVGVTPPGFVGLWPESPPAAFIPIVQYGAQQSANFQWLKQGRNWWTTYSWGWMNWMGRRKPGVSIQTANADLTNAARLSYQKQLVEQKRSPPIELAKPRAIAASILAERGPNESSTAKVATWVAGVSVIVLLIACANVANLLLARAIKRRREVAVRLALGASRRRLGRQLLTESLVLAGFGALLGLIIAQWGGSVLRTSLLPKTPETAAFADPRSLVFAGIAALTVGLLAGLAPVFQAVRAGGSLAADLKAGAREGTYHRSLTRVVLLVIQGALSVVLLVGAGLFVRSLHNARAMRLGYDSDPVDIVSLNMRGVTLDSAHAAQLRQRLVEVARTIPGVTHVSTAAVVPFQGQWSTGLWVEGIDTVSRLGQFDLNAVTPEHFAVFGTRILRGRGFTDQDNATAPKVMVASDGMAKTLWPGKDAIGQCIRVNNEKDPCTTVVGIAEDIRQQSLASDSGYYTYYLPAAQFKNDNDLAIRTAGSGAKYAEIIRRRLQPEMPGASYVTVLPFAEVIGGVTRSWQLGATMFVAFGILALVLAAVGLYSVIAYNVAQRTHELGVRVALGAQMADVIRLVLSEGVKLGAIGLAFGAIVALWAGRWVKPLLLGESPNDPAVFVVVTVTLLLVTVAASWIPARRAAGVDPQVALRTE